MKNNEEFKNEVKDVLTAVKIALNYLTKKGIVVFSREIRSVYRSSTIWIVEMDSKKFSGAIIIDSKTGDVAKQLPL